jgi:chorismate synthase
MNCYGKNFKITIFGGSHTPVLGIEIQGCPSGIKILQEDFTEMLSRRKPGKRGTTGRIESDIPLLRTGLKDNITTGESIRIEFENKNIHPHHYNDFKIKPRPGHADFVAMKKYGNSMDISGGGMFSGRMTVAIVAAGVVAMKLLDQPTWKLQFLKS